MRRLIAGILAVAAVALAAEGDGKPGRTEVSKEGTLVCVGCHLEKRHGARAQCTLYSKHAQGLLASDGALWTFLDNTRGHELVTNRKLLGKPVRVHGWGFPGAQVLEARRYDLREGEAWTAYDFCRNCGWERGNHDGKDLCGGCETGEGCK